ncbi:hypothetical protein, partial [Dialister succinatiphilus]|uniref:hypothetical protein n=1 Tax=Dialister succinatiphilus TaxID=487173 RepID=UPI003AF65055
MHFCFSRRKGGASLAALFDPLPAGTKKSALLRRTSVLRSKTLAEGEFTSPEHLNFLPESKKSALLRRT